MIIKEFSISLDQQVIESHLTTLRNASTAILQQQAIENYYNYLSSQNVTYASLGLQVATNVGGFGSFANDILTSAGYGNKIADVKIALAIADADLRNQNLLSNGSGILNARTIADYHYDVYESPTIGIPRAAWGGAFYEEFVGTGSWLELGTTGYILAGDVSGAINLYLNDLFQDQPDRNGVDIGDAVSYLRGAVGGVNQLNQAM